MNKVAVVGMGTIGSHLVSRLKENKVEICFTYRRHQQGPSFERLLDLKKPFAVFFAISNRDTGEEALGLMLECLIRGIRVITCEKGALAYHADILASYMHLIGYGAVVGGGTRMLYFLKGRNLSNGPVKIQAVVNGTLNFILDAMSGGSSLDEACGQARELKYAEPNATDPLSLINGELEDVSKKVCVMYNLLCAQGEYITPELLKPIVLNEKSLNTLSDLGGDYRVVVTLSNNGIGEYSYFGEKMGGAKFGDWHIEGGFRNSSSESGLRQWVPQGVFNAVRVSEGRFGANCTLTLSGQGAGPKPTVTSMLVDFHELYG